MRLINCYCKGFWQFVVMRSFRSKNSFLSALTISATLGGCFAATAQTSLAPSSTQLKKLSLEELMNIEVSLVSKSPQKLSEVPSAIQVITDEDIRRSGATQLTEALRLASNLMVAQTNSHDWAITSRGFNGAPLANYRLANKLLVMINGRSIYSPLFGGVFWDAQSVFLEDIDRIEVVSGPGGTLWGANAVNGVINVITKKASDTQGLFVSAAAGTFLKDVASLRYGGKITKGLSFRAYARRKDYKDTKLSNGTGANDDWGITQGGFRMDYDPSEKNSFSLSGDGYDGREDSPTSADIDGQNVLASWEHKFSRSSKLSARFYFDKTSRNVRSAPFRDELKTYDFDMQHSFELSAGHKILWGVNYRMVNDNTVGSSTLSFSPANRKLDLVTGFIQDQVTIIPRSLEFTFGTKISHNDYSKFDYQPSVRLAWSPTKKQTIWSAVSGAVRTPSRFDTDEITTFLMTPGHEFESEKLTAFELGYRLQPSEKASLSAAIFFNKYRQLRSIDVNTASTTPRFIFANNQRSESHGFELSGNLWISEQWRLRAGYTYFNKSIWKTKSSVIPSSDDFEAIDPNNQFMLQSIIDIIPGLETDFLMRYVSALPQTSLTAAVPDYFTLDLHVAKRFKWLEATIVGQNLLNKYHREFASQQIPRGIYGKLTFRF
jgi:iron complex outermembrane receptor protein